MLELTTTVKKLIDFALLQLWYADHWKKIEDMNPLVKIENTNGFRSQASGIVQFIYTEIISGDQLIDYRGIKVPENILPYFEEREKFYKHPKD